MEAQSLVALSNNGENIRKTIAQIHREELQSLKRKREIKRRQNLIRGIVHVDSKKDASHKKRSGGSFDLKSQVFQRRTQLNK